MPAADAQGDVRNDHERQDRPDKKQKSSSSNSKSKDLSHVPCKFFKVGGCTAGPSCPFSHTLPEPGQKEHCAWFVKGNCKFGHKCALAHVLPGQDMSMDRKNKKAAQQAAAAAGGHERGGKDRGGKKREGGGADRGSGGKNPLLAGGSTAPTRVLNSGSSGASGAGRPPMNLPLKAAISPSAPAPPLNDNDFASFAPLDEMEGVSDDPKQKPQPSDADASSQALPVSAARGPSSTPQNDFGPIGSPPNARSPMRPNSNNTATFSPGTSPRNLNGISASPNTANAAGILSSSPFSAPGNQTTFHQPSSYGATLGLTGGVAASWGTGLAMMGGGRKAWGDPSSFDPSSPSNAPYMSTSHQQRTSGLSTSVTRIEEDYEFGNASRNLRKIPGLRNDHAVLDEEMEDALPGSLTDLLTPEERNRRMSRSNSGQPPHHGLTALANTLKGDETPSGSSGMGIGHRHSRSVPAPSLLGDLKSIWADTSGNGLPASPGNTSHMTHRGTPSASGLSARFESLGLGNGGGAIDEAGLSMSFGSPSSIGMMSPSNASAAFLPGFRETYLAAKAKQQAAQGGQSGLGRGLRSVSGGSGLYPGTDAPGRVNNNTNSLANNYLQPMSAAGLPASMNSSSTLHTHIHGTTQHTYRTPSSPFDLTQSMNMIRKGGGGLGGLGNGPSGLGGGTGLGIGSDLAGLDDPLLLGPQISSPSTRALQSHAPGQSLPQGLAAGLSRIHALPPLSNLVSPGTPSGLGAAGYLSASPGNALASNAAHHNVYGGGDWSSGVGGAGMGGMISGSPLVQSTVAPGNGHGEHQLQTHQPQPRNGASGLTSALSAGAPPGLPGLPERTGAGSGAGGATGQTGTGTGSKMSYSAAAAAARAASATPTAPPGITRNVGYAAAHQHQHQQHQQQGQHQQQRGAAANHDDDELFDMDG